jgi:CBS domain containing-hemolysin-like protein
MVEHSQTLFITLFTTCFLSLGALFFISSFLYFARRERKERLLRLFSDPKRSLYFRLHPFLFGSRPETLIFCIEASKHILQLIFILSSSFLFFSVTQNGVFEITIFFLLLLFLIIVFGDLLPRLVAVSVSPLFEPFIKPLASCVLFVTLPVTGLLALLFHLTFLEHLLLPPPAQNATKEKLLDLVQDLTECSLLSPHDRNLFLALFNFRDRIVREVMVPRINLFCISEATPIRAALSLLERENYSRVPLFRDSIDNISGVIMYKDILLHCLKKPDLLDNPVSTISKKVFFTPETKKISQLLQEFRLRQTHMAIVVDEYGGTAGAITIEDILEEIVGEIADEYDQEAALITPAGKDSWIVAARMNLLDLEEETAIHIPQVGEYDTIAGYILWRLGTIPQKGTHIHEEQFEIEILTTGERTLEKVKITTLAPQ